jgi:hypothetical protein
MSAMALIFKLKFNKIKLRLFLRESGVFKLKTVQPSLNIRESHWNNVTALPLATSGEFKSLGFIHSLGGPGSQFGIYLDYVKKVCKVIGSKMALPKGKILALNVHLFNKTAYVGQYGSWPLSQYRELDIPVQTLLRKVTFNLPSHPNRLLYMKRSDGGLQLKKLSDQCMLAKYSLIHRSLHADPATHDCVNNLLLRCARRTGRGILDACLTLRPMVGTATLWADSVVDWLHENGLSLTRGGQPLVGANREIATLCGNLKTEQLELIKVVKAGVCSVGDLVSADHKEACWRNPTLVGAPWLSGVLPGLPVLPSTLRRGQLWKISAKSGGLGGVVEILGGPMSMLQVKIWAVTGKSINLARGAVLSLNSTVLGAGADI